MLVQMPVGMLCVRFRPALTVMRFCMGMLMQRSTLVAIRVLMRRPASAPVAVGRFNATRSGETSGRCATASDDQSVQPWRTCRKKELQSDQQLDFFLKAMLVHASLGEEESGNL